VCPFRRDGGASASTCRCRDRRCQGGYGPPCFFERRTFSADVLCDDMHDYRESWAETHVTLKQRKLDGTIR
jgi:hypothetical protein